MKKSIFLSLIFFINLCFFTVNAQERRFSANFELVKVNKGKKVTIKGEVHYNIETGKMVMVFSAPLKYIYISTSKGEAQIYQPKENTVSVKNDQNLSSKEDMLYYFVTNKTNDLGLLSVGYVIEKTTNEKGLVRKIWKNSNPKQKIPKVEMVYKFQQPIYSAYFDAKENLKKKIFYSDYLSFGLYSVPMKIVEIDYVNAKDSTISKKTYSGVKTNKDAISPYYSYKVPANARVIKM